MSMQTFDPKEHCITMERKSKQKDGTWLATKTEYLPVQWRLFWFRLENPKGKVDSHMLTIDLERGAAIFETYVEREDGGSARMHGSETAGDWKDYIEKAQTKSLGRSLAAVGYGSQFTDTEFDEGERIVDSPVPIQQSTNGAAQETGTRAVTRSTTPAETLKAVMDHLKSAGVVSDAAQWLAWKKTVLGADIPNNKLSGIQITQLYDAMLAQEREKGAA